MKKLVALLFIVTLAVAFAGCEQFIDFRPSGTISGYVTDARGGPGVEGATVKGCGRQVQTDEDGFFELEVWADFPFEMMILKEGRGNVRVQGVRLEEGEELFIDMPSRDKFLEGYSALPLTIALDGLERNQEVSGEIEFEVSVEGDNPLYSLYGFYNGSSTMGFDADLWMETDAGEFIFDSTLYPNGIAYLTFFAFDLAGNLTIHEIPVYIDNEEVVHEQEPMDIPFLITYSMTWGMNPGIYLEQREERWEKLDLEGDPAILELAHGVEFDLESAPAGAALYNVIQWPEIPDAVGYELHRSFDGSDFDKIADLTVNVFFDTCPTLFVDQETFYKVVAYNSYGKGGASPVVSTTPLDAFNVYLGEPADGATGVELQPTFTWTHDGDFDDEVDLYHDIHLFEATWWKIWEDCVLNEEEIELPFALEPMVTYTWDIFNSEAYIEYQDDAEGLAFASSFAGRRDGSMDGEFIFTTGSE